MAAGLLLLLLDTPCLHLVAREQPASGRCSARKLRPRVVFVSVASAREASIKIALGKLRRPESFEAGVVASRFDGPPITFRNALPPHHSDPFDRMLAAQAIASA